MLELHELKTLAKYSYVKRADAPANESYEKVKGLMKDYAPSVGAGGAAGAIAGIPLGLLMHAMTASKEKRTLRDYLKSGLLGSLGLGVLGAAGGGVGKYYGHDLSDMASSAANDFFAPKP